MRRELGSITPHKGQKNVWLVRVTLADGKRKNKVVRGSKKQAAEELNRMLAFAGHKSNDITFKEFCELKYIPWHDSIYNRPDSMKKWHMDMEILIKEWGSRKLSTMRRDVMETWAANARGHLINKMKAVLNKAYQWEYIDRNPLQGISDKRKQPSKKRFSVDDAKLILNTVKDSDIEVIVLLMLFGGLRRGEALGLDWQNIDFRTGKVTISRTYHYDEGKGWFEDTKNPTSRRVITLDAHTLARLREIRSRGGILRMGAVCVGVGMRRMPPNTIADKWLRLMKPILGDRYLPMKNLRHTHASLALEGGASMEAIAKRLGHASTKLTESTYAESEKIEASCAAVISNILC